MNNIENVYIELISVIQQRMEATPHISEYADLLTAMETSLEEIKKSN